MFLVDLSETKAGEARKAADNVALLAAAKVCDLDEEETPESLMLSTMTEEGSKERTDREVVVPWLRFLWEIYRAVLELLFKNAKLEKVYHKTCEKAFRFCQDYSRKFEFRKLCEILRNQLMNVQKLTGQNNRQNKPSWEWTTETVEMYLTTRFMQLEVAIQLELWTEGFKTVDEIYTIMQLGKKMPKPRLMSAYYEKLTRVFWVTGNNLFHAYAWYRYFTLCCECRKEMKAEERTSQANTVLLATLCIPEEGATTSTGPLGSNAASAAENEEGVSTDKNKQLALLLDFSTNPSRQALLAEIVAGGILNDVSPGIRTMYELLECSFRPLSLVKELVPLLSYISEVPAQAIYASSLKKVIVVRGAQQLSKVYSTVKIDFLKNLLSGLELPFFEIERLLVSAVSRKQVQLRIDHSSGTLKFGAEVAASTAIDDHLAQLGNSLKRFMSLVRPAEEQEASAEESRKAYLHQVAQAIRDGPYSSSGYSMLDRKMLIERRKEEREYLQKERLREEENRRKNEEQKRLEDEQKRLQEEEEIRNLQKLAKLQFMLTVTKTKNAMALLGKHVEESQLMEMDDAALQKLLLDTQLESQRAKEEEVKKMAEAAKKLDYTVRAVRIECAPLVQTRADELLAQDYALYEQRVSEARRVHKENYDLAVENKAKLFDRMASFTRAFEDSLLGNQKTAFEKQIAAARKRAFVDLRDRRVASARYRKREEDERIEMEEELARERAQKEEADKLLLEQQEKLRRDRQAKDEADREREKLEEERRQEAARNRVEPAVTQRLNEPEAPTEVRTTEAWRPSYKDRVPSTNIPPRSFDNGDRDYKGFGAGGGDAEGSTWRRGASGTKPEVVGGFGAGKERGGADKGPGDRWRPERRDAGPRPRYA